MLRTSQRSRGAQFAALPETALGLTVNPSLAFGEHLPPAFQPGLSRREHGLDGRVSGVVGPQNKFWYVKQLTAPRESGSYFAPTAPTAVGSIPLREGAMPSPEIWSKSVPTVELDQRSREARIRFESMERLLVPRAAVTYSRIRRSLLLVVSADPTTRRQQLAFERR